MWVLVPETIQITWVLGFGETRLATRDGMPHQQMALPVTTV